MKKTAPTRKVIKAEEVSIQRLTITLPSDLYSEVERIATRDSRSLSFVIRKAVEGLVREEQPLFSINKE